MQKIKRQKQLIAAGLLLLATSQTAFAHTVMGSLLSTNGANSTDYYEIDCGTDIVGQPVTDTHHLRFTVQDLVLDSNQVGVTGSSASAGANVKAYTTIDPAGGTTTPNPLATAQTIIGGSGKYYLAVFKTGAGAQIYYLHAYCERADGWESTATGLVITAPSTLISNQ